MKAIFFKEVSTDDLKKIVSEAVKAEFEGIKNRPDDDHSLMSREEAAKYLKVSLPTLNSWTKSGDIKAYRKKGRVYYKQHEIEESLTEIKWTPKKKFI